MLEIILRKQSRRLLNSTYEIHCLGADSLQAKLKGDVDPLTAFRRRGSLGLVFEQSCIVI